MQQLQFWEVHFLINCAKSYLCSQARQLVLGSSYRAVLFYFHTVERDIGPVGRNGPVARTRFSPACPPPSVPTVVISEPLRHPEHPPGARPPS